MRASAAGTSRSLSLRTLSRAGRLLGAGALSAAAIAYAAGHFMEQGEATGEDAFLAAGDAARAEIADYYWRSADAGTPHLPKDLAELGPGELPIDPWTGAADWRVLRNAAGEVVGVYSRSHHAVRDRQRFGAFAQLRSDIPPSSPDRQGASAWVFRWEPPRARAASQMAGMLTARDALEGRWPDAPASRDRPVAGAGSAQATQAPPLQPIAGKDTRQSHARSAGRPRSRLPASGPARSESNGAGARAQITAALDSSKWSIYVPLAPVGDDSPTASAQPAPPGGSASDDGARPEGAESAEKLAPVVASFEFSSDPRLRRCQMGLGLASADIGACRDAKAQDDAGIAYDACMRDLELRVAQCAAQR